MRLALAPTLLLLLLATPAEGSETLSDDLEELARWCATNKLYRARREVYEALLVLDPDHAVARKGLKYRRGKHVSRLARILCQESRPKRMMRL